MYYKFTKFFQVKQHSGNSFHTTSLKPQGSQFRVRPSKQFFMLMFLPQLGFLSHQRINVGSEAYRMKLTQAIHFSGNQ